MITDEQLALLRRHFVECEFLGDDTICCCDKAIGQRIWFENHDPEIPHEGEYYCDECGVKHLEELEEFYEHFAHNYNEPEATEEGCGLARLYGGQALGIGKMTADPFKQSTRVMPEADYDNEGFAFLDQIYNSIETETDVSPLYSAFIKWQEANQIMTVVPFEIKEVFPKMKEKYSTDEEIIRCVKALVKVLP